MDKYKMSMWFYNRQGVVTNEDYMENTKRLAINLGMTPPFDEKTSSKEEMIKFLDMCVENGMQVFLSDKRVTYNRLHETDEESFRKGVMQAKEDFGSHSAIYGFLVGDEPVKDTWDSAVKAFKIVQEIVPGLTHLINFYPCYWNGFDKLIGCSHEEYPARVDAFIKETGAPIVSYDYYGQCGYVDKIKWIDIYFRNLNMFGKIARDNDKELFTSLLSIGHWMYRCPNEDDFRWQISTAVAHGVVGIMWFFIFATGLRHENYRVGPIDVFGERSEAFEWLSRENRIFMQFIAKELKDYSFEKVEHFLVCYGNTPSFTASGALKKIDYRENPKPLAISYYRNEKGEECIGVTNLCQDEPTAAQLTFEGEFEKYNENYRLAPGQIRVFTKNKTV